MELHNEKIVKALPSSKNTSDLLIKINHTLKLPIELKTRNEVMCRKCLTPWSMGKFSLTLISANNRRRKRRQHRIERLEEQIKSDKILKTGVATLTRKLKRLQQQNNHLAIYKCFCKTETKVQVKMPAVETSLETKAIQEVKKEDKVKKVREKKVKGKKKKTAGLIIPKQIRSTSPQPSTSKGKTSGKITKEQLSSFFATQQKASTEAFRKRPMFDDFLAYNIDGSDDDEMSFTNEFNIDDSDDSSF